MNSQNLRRLRALPLLAFVFFWSVAAHDVAPTIYFTVEEKAALANGVPAPPQTGSDQDKADLAAVLKAQESRTPEQIAEIKADAEFNTTLFRDVSGTDERTAPATWALLAKVNQEATAIYRQAKDKFQRARPFKAHPDVIKNIVDASSFSYPSGHSTRAYVEAAVLSELLPDKKDALFARAAQIANSRVVGGEHYPSDIEAGAALAHAISTALLVQKPFQDDLEAAKLEMQREPPEKTFHAAVEKAQTEYDLRVRAARERCIVALKTELAAATKKGDLPVVTEIAARIEAMTPHVVIEPGAPVSLVFEPTKDCIMRHGPEQETIIQSRDNDKCIAWTAETFRPPFTIVAVAKINETDLRLFYGTGSVIFNWKDSQQELRYRDFVTEKDFGVAGQGWLPINEYVTIVFKVTTENVSVSVDGKERYFKTGDYGGLDSKFGIGTA